VDELRQINHVKVGKRLHLTKGIHLVVPHKKLPVQQSVYFDIPDGRMMFAIPRGKKTYFGTTDTNYQQNKDNIEITLADALYLIEAVNNMFPNITLTLEDIESSWAGLRPLIHEEGKSASELSRKDEIFVSETELISIAGGKLTGYRKMAERVVDLIAKKICKRFGINVEPVQTEEIVLSGGPFQNYKSVELYCKQVYKRIKPLGFKKEKARYLVHNYGKQTDTILNKMEEYVEEDSIEKLWKAEVWFTIQHEMACTPIDFFMRRTGCLFFNKPSVDKYQDLVLKEFMTYFEWDIQTFEKHQKELAQKIKLTVQFA
jgi:glycerol-3-phosphate dehydrogenase